MLSRITTTRNIWRLLFLLASSTIFAHAFVPIASQPLKTRALSSSFEKPSTVGTSKSTTHLNAGFGAAGGSSKKNKQTKTESKLKPKQQWDRYCTDLKKETARRVAVRVAGDGEEDNEWLGVGNIKSEGGKYTEVAVARQRALIVDVSCF